MNKPSSKLVFGNMFLNDIGQPLILDPNKKYSPFEQHSGPLLLTSAVFQEQAAPTNWCRIIVGSEKDVTWFQNNVVKQCDYNYIVLKPNDPTEIDCGSTKSTLTLIPAGPNAHVYLQKNGCTNVLIADNLSEYLDFIPKALPSFHFALREGIDVMYVDDACYISNDEQMKAQKENIYALVQLIRPRYLYGLREDKLPKSLLDLCALKDVFALPEK